MNANSETTTDDESATHQCVFLLSEDLDDYCPEDAVGKFPVEVDYEGGTAEGAVWLYEEHSPEGEPRLCEYCENNPAVEWSDQGRAQCEECSPPTVSGNDGGQE